MTQQISFEASISRAPRRLQPTPCEWVGSNVGLFSPAEEIETAIPFTFEQAERDYRKAEEEETVAEARKLRFDGWVQSFLAFPEQPDELPYTPLRALRDLDTGHWDSDATPEGYPELHDEVPEEIVDSWIEAQKDPPNLVEDAEIYRVRRGGPVGDFITLGTYGREMASFSANGLEASAPDSDTDVAGLKQRFLLAQEVILYMISRAERWGHCLDLRLLNDGLSICKKTMREHPQEPLSWHLDQIYKEKRGSLMDSREPNNDPIRLIWAQPRDFVRVHCNKGSLFDDLARHKYTTIDERSELRHPAIVTGTFIDRNERRAWVDVFMCTSFGDGYDRHIRYHLSTSHLEILRDEEPTDHLHKQPFFLRMAPGEQMDKKGYVNITRSVRVPLDWVSPWLGAQISESSFELLRSESKRKEMLLEMHRLYQADREVYLRERETRELRERERERDEVGMLQSRIASLQNSIATLQKELEDAIREAAETRKDLVQKLDGEVEFDEAFPWIALLHPSELAWEILLEEYKDRGQEYIERAQHAEDRFNRHSKKRGMKYERQLKEKQEQEEHAKQRALRRQALEDQRDAELRDLPVEELRRRQLIYAYEQRREALWYRSNFRAGGALPFDPFVDSALRGAGLRVKSGEYDGEEESWFSDSDFTFAYYLDQRRKVQPDEVHDWQKCWDKDRRCWKHLDWIPRPRRVETSS